MSIQTAFTETNLLDGTVAKQVDNQIATALGEAATVEVDFSFLGFSKDGTATMRKFVTQLEKGTGNISLVIAPQDTLPKDEKPLTEKQIMDALGKVKVNTTRKAKSK